MLVCEPQGEGETWWVPEEEQEQRVSWGSRDFVLALVQAARLARRAVAERRCTHEFQYSLYRNFFSKHQFLLGGRAEEDAAIGDLREGARKRVVTRGVSEWSFSPARLIQMSDPGEMGAAGVDVRGDPDEEKALKNLLAAVGHGQHAYGAFYRHQPAGVDKR